MNVRVHGRNMQVGEDIMELAEEKVLHAGRIFDDGASVDVEFTESHNPRLSDGRYRVEITSLAAGHTVRVEAEAFDARAALDVAADKYERQLRKLKERLVQRSRRAENKALNEASSSPEEEDVQGLNIVRTKRFAMRPMTPEEAALQMDLLGHEFFFFLDAESGRYSVLYHRRDGSLGLIEPE